MSSQLISYNHSQGSDFVFAGHSYYRGEEEEKKEPRHIPGFCEIFGIKSATAEVEIMRERE